MKGMKGKLLRKLRFIPSFSTSKQDVVLQQDPLEKPSNRNRQTLPFYNEQDGKSNLSELLVGSTEVVADQQNEHSKDEEMELDFIAGDKDGFTSSVEFEDMLLMPAKENPEVTILSHSIMERGSTQLEAKDSEEYTSLLHFDEKCPPGGSQSVVLYTTSMRGIRKTFEDCHTIRFLLESFKVLFDERDVSMHLEYREELWSTLGGRVIPPRLFIKGRYIGGANEVVGLHEQGKLRKLLEGIPLDSSSSSCSGCANVRFVLCLDCNGSRKIVADEENDDLYIRCPECNENGLIKCPTCCREFN